MHSLRIILLLLGLSLPAWGQQEFTNWCFGYGIGNLAGYVTLVKFTPTPQAADTCSWENLSILGFGNAAISDAAGNLLLYTDGVRINNRRHRPMTGGELLDATLVVTQLGTAMFQPTVIVPAGLSHYYVFYWTPVRQDGAPAYDLTYAVVDMRQQGGDGAVVRKGLVLTRTFCPRLTAVRHANNRDFWVLTRDLDTRGFQAFRLGTAAAPVGPAVVSLAGQARFPDLAELKAAPDGQRLSCGSLTREADGPRAGVCVYDFDPASGRVSNELVVRSVAVPPFSATAAGRPLTESPLFSSSFSPDSRLLYTCELPTPFPSPAGVRRGRDIWQYNLGLTSPAAIIQSRRLVSDVPLPPAAFDFLDCLGLQLAPDGTLWSSVCYRRRPLDPATNQLTRQAAAIIRHPNVYGPGCGFEAEGYSYQPGQLYGSNLPNLITNMLYAPAALNYEATCPEDSVQFWASSAGDPAGLRWDFGEPASGPANAASGPFVAHRYAQGGTYTVRLTLADGRVLTQSVQVSGAVGDFTNTNVFTPNGDGRNDEFRPVRVPLPGGRLRVFSRWGTLVHETADPALRWDGAGAAGGEYFYQLEYPDCRGTVRQQRGTLTLVR